MSNKDIPFTLDNQIKTIKKYVVFRNKTKVEKLLIYTGYFRVSKYAKDLYSFLSAGILSNKPNQNQLIAYYEFDVKLRKILFNYTKKAEIQFKTHISNSISLKLGNPIFYLDDNNYTSTKGAKDKVGRNKNKENYSKFKKNIADFEKKLRTSIHKYPEFKEYTKQGKKKKMKIPCWAIFSYLDFGSMMHLYSYLKLDLRKEVLKYGYNKNADYSKLTTRCVDTWLDAIRNLRNICSHHNKLILKTSSIVLEEKSDTGILISYTDLFSRLYALKKILNQKDSLALKSDLKKLLNKTPINVYTYNILPIDWEIKYDSIRNL
ncbi:Abortive infection bacteriophage resistance protein [Cetobacterium ceti]|uniref:Abortive infection bacteriophage resistance protein n=1 Tax=Cetobacterium ceti TaxID=180163 RepID=A0A1T4PVH2_9FUSO|nr:Abi family protein [Cetobacterium ceti]SJZ95449.1 Abortive infection bacteriophage resistance protein [Cetobacterium ceti]